MPQPRIIQLDTTTSTMDEARQHAATLVQEARTNTPEAHAALRDGVLIIAQTQTGGRGTHGRSWHSPRGALLGTFLRRIDAHEPGAFIPPTTLRTALGIARLAEHWLADAPHAQSIRIKWPNDILLGDAKLAGILTELIDHPGTPPIHIALIGVGLNANNPRPDMPSGARAAASLSEHRAAPLDLTDAGEQLARALQAATDHPRSPLSPDELHAMNQRLHARGASAMVRVPRSDPDARQAARIDAINPDGTLRVLTSEAPHAIARTADIAWPGEFV